MTGTRRLPSTSSAFRWFTGYLMGAVSLAACSRSTLPRSHGEPEEGTRDGGAAGGETSMDGLAGNGAGGGVAGGGVGGQGGRGSAGAGGSSPSPFCNGDIPPTSQIPRLTNAQYDRTVADLLELTTLTTLNAAPSSALAPDHPGEMTEATWTSYLNAAAAIAAQVIADPELKGKFIACVPEEDANCWHDTIQRFGRRAFRRPLRDDEQARFEALVAEGASITPNGTTDEVAEMVLTTFLASPSFIQRAEIAEVQNADGNYVLSSHEVAARLSYLLWGTMPDDTLATAADAGALSTAEAVRAQAVRLLEHEKAKHVVVGFHRELLRMVPSGRWERVTKDPAQFPQFSAAVVPAMVEETEKFFEHVVLNQRGTIADLFLSQTGFVNEVTAPLYGLDPTAFGAELEQVDLDPNERPGFLTRIGFLTAYGYEQRTSPILRGAFITRDVLGIDVGPPHPMASETSLPSDDALLTNRERVDQQTAAAACSACHQAFLNPPGFVLEAYDSVGARQTVEYGSGAPIDTVADVSIDGATVTIADPAELMAALAASFAVRDSYAQRWVEYAFNRQPNDFDACIVETLSARADDPSYAIVDLLVDLTQTGSFRVRALQVIQ